jgi:hypothetical protein
MSTYLLLRNNKETGPFTIEEIQEMSLKSYDLVWTVGKSAAWRYPGEIPEFRSFAPAVPEQPEGLFGKKKNSENISSDILNKKSESQNIKARETGVPRHAFSNSVYVNLPAEKKSASVSPAGILYENELQPEAAPAYDFSDIYRKKPSSVVRLSVKLIWISSIMLLFGTGILTGFFISDRRKFFSSNADRTQKPIPLQPVAQSTSYKLSPEMVSLTSTGSPASPAAGPGQPFKGETSVSLKNGASSGKKSVRNTVKKDSLSAVIPNKTTANLTDSSQKQNSDNKLELIDLKVKANPENYIDMVTGHFSTGLFGGISAVPITVTNNSPVLIDQVTVTVAYIQSNDKVFKTEDIIFSDLEPGETLTEKAPKSPRGTKITTRIRQISSLKLDLNYSK